ncbi:uncharacterized protein LOC119081596 [Bradysia coprophila]|uniref:uncharacterized protein LOC119081596 n=1 Tax=Bradysia coprophila TaxID=38358 RepID=UPI00187D8FF6|nr:uncharacterized protein LOC119081596 [Bradysia coprophila]
MNSKTAEFLSKLMLEDDGDDVVFFAFPNQKKKIRCSVSMLTEISPVFGAMLSTWWSQENPLHVDDTQPHSFVTHSQDKTIQLSDDVNFDQYSTFKLLIQILYGLRQMDSLTVEQATNIFFYAHKYEIKDAEDKIQKFLNERMESGMGQVPLSVAELTEGIEFAQLYHLDGFKKKLDQVKLAFDEENLTPFQFWDLSIKFEMKTLQDQIIDRMMNVAPKKDWPFDLLIAVTERLQTLMKKTKKAVVYCRYCGSSN